MALAFTGCKKGKEEKKVENKPVKPDVMKPEVKKPEEKKPEVKKPEVKKPEEKKPEVKKPEEKKPVVAVVVPAEKDMPETMYLSSKFVTSDKKIKDDIKKQMEAMNKFIAGSKGKIKSVGAPMVCYYNKDMKKLQGELFFAVEKECKGKGAIKFSKVKARKVLAMVHKGPYEKLMDTYNAMTKFVTEKKLEVVKDLACEVYQNDPSKVKPEELKTEVFFEIAPAKKDDKKDAKKDAKAPAAKKPVAKKK